MLAPAVFVPPIDIAVFAGVKVAIFVPANDALFSRASFVTDQGALFATHGFCIQRLVTALEFASAQGHVTLLLTFDFADRAF